MSARSVEVSKQVASVFPVEQNRIMTRLERLRRWADLLDRHYGSLRLLHQTELAPEARRNKMRERESPMSIAYADPVLRLQGLDGETYADARDFFELSDVDAHLILCDCHSESLTLGSTVARRVRSVAEAPTRSLLAAITFGSVVTLGLSLVALLG